MLCKVVTVDVQGFHGELLRAQVAAMGRLALVADALGEGAIAATVRSNMKAVLVPWLGDTNADKLQYDPSWGGVCSSAGLANGEPDLSYYHMCKSQCILYCVLRMDLSRNQACVTTCCLLAVKPLPCGSSI